MIFVTEYNINVTFHTIDKVGAVMIFDGVKRILIQERDGPLVQYKYF